MRSYLPCLGFIVLMLHSLCGYADTSLPPESRNEREMVAFPAQWSFGLPKQAMILTSDRDLEDISSDPDKVIDLSLTFDKDSGSLRQRCEAVQKSGGHTLILAFDHFFRQYRPGQDHARELMPDMPEYIEKIAKVSKFAQQYGVGLELSLLTPLEIGKGYREQTGESGVWMQYRKGLRDPNTGQFSIQLWRQKRWENNKGFFDIEDAGVRVFAFRESVIHGTPYRVVPEDSIVEITNGIEVEELGEPTPGFPATRIRVFGNGVAQAAGLNRVLVVQVYRTPEMDFFSENATAYLTNLVDRYADAGVKLNALYSDEPHLMGDWAYHAHHEHGQFAMRYVSPGFVKKFAERYGEKYRDFAKYLIYFAYGQEDFAHDLSATQGIMHVWGASQQEIRQTALFRSRYYKFLQDGLADLLVNAKHHAERRMGQRLEARAHATWAESPTCDAWVQVEGVFGPSKQYEYTSDFLWSNTVHQSAVACSDYFRWGDFLTGNGNDHAEGGFLDRNYFGLALACSTGSINDIPFSYGAHWGIPNAISHRRSLAAFAFGALQWHGSDVQGFEHRDVDVLMLYPIDLVAVEERFGSWMNQYGYANMITQQKLLEMGTVTGGAVEIAGRRYTTLVATFEPFPSHKLLTMMKVLAEQGGRVVWSGPAPVLTDEGTDALAAWSSLFGVEYQPLHQEGLPVPGQQIRFEGTLENVPPQIVLTHFLVDHVYPVGKVNDAEVVARLGRHVIGTHRRLPGGGSATFLGFRPLDNQSASLGYDSRTWFDALNGIGAYPASPEAVAGGTVNDNTESLSRTGEYLVCRFPNGAVTIANHLKLTEERWWDGGFARNNDRDAKYMEENPLPPDTISLKDFQVNGHTVGYEGNQIMAFRVNEAGQLIGFSGHNTTGLTINGQTFPFAENPIPMLVFTPVPEKRRVPGGAVFEINVHGTGTIRVPFFETDKPVQIFTQGPTPGSKGREVTFQREDNALILDATELSGQWLWVVPTAN